MMRCIAIFLFFIEMQVYAMSLEMTAAQDAKKAGEWQTCIRILEDLFATNVAREPTLFTLGECYEGVGESDKAKAAYVGAFMQEQDPQAGAWLSQHLSAEVGVWLDDLQLRMRLQEYGSVWSALLATAAGLVWLFGTMRKRGRWLQIYALVGLTLGIAMHSYLRSEKTYVGVALQDLSEHGIARGTVVVVKNINGGDATVMRSDGSVTTMPIMNIRLFAINGGAT